MPHDPTQRHPAGNRVPKRSSSRAGSSQDTAPSLFDAVDEPRELAAIEGSEGRRRRDDGMATAAHAAHLWTKSAIDRWIDERREPWTTDDLRAEVEPFASSPNIIGARVNAAARRGHIERIGFRQSTRPEAHGRWITVWAPTGGGAA